MQRTQLDVVLSAKNPFALRDYRLWFGATSLLSISAATGVATSLVLIDLTGSAVIAGAVTTTVAIADMAGGILGGGLADAHSRRRILNRAMIGALLLNAVIILTVFVQDSWAPAQPVALLAIVVALILGGFFVSLADPALDGGLKAIIPARAYSRAVSAAQARESVISVVGNPLTGFMYSLSAAFPFVLRVLCQTVFLLLVHLIQTPLGPNPIETDPDRPPRRQYRSIIPDAVRSYRESFSFIWSLPAMRRFLIAAPMVNVMVSVFSLWIVFQLRAVGHSATAIGLVLSGLALGALVGSTITPFASDRIPPGWLAISGLALMTVFFVTLTLTPQTPAVMFALSLCAMIPSPPLNAGIFTYVFSETSLKMQGRVIATFKALGGVAFAVAPVLAGAAVSYDISHVVLGAACLLSALAVIILLTSRDVRSL